MRAASVLAMAAVMAVDVSASAWDTAVVRVTRSPATLQVPRIGVARRQVLSGKVNMPGYPVILVRADHAKARWWVQEHVTLKPDRSFSGEVLFGNEKTLDRTQFHVVVVVLQNSAELEGWKPGGVLEELPDGVPRSEEIVAVYRRDRDGGPVVDDLLQEPRSGAVVQRRQAVSGRLKTAVQSCWCGHRKPTVRGGSR